MESKPVVEWEMKPAVFLGDRLIIGGHQVMMSWEAPYMQKMVDILLGHTRGRILEVGFGMGISASRIQAMGVESHTIIEPHPEVFEKAIAWKGDRSNIELLADRDLLQKSRLLLGEAQAR